MPHLTTIASMALGALFALAQTPQVSPQAGAIAEGLDYYCLDWLARETGARTVAPNAKGTAAGWREQRSAAPAVGPILIKGGEWGQVSLVRVAQAGGNRCSMAIQLSSEAWSTETAYAAVSAWAQKTWPQAAVAKTRGEGPRGTRESIWRAGGDSLTLQEAPTAGTQPNVFITLQRAREI